MRYSSQIILMCFASSLKAQVKQTNFPGVNKNNVYSITRFQNTVFVGGAFDTIGNVARNHLAAVDANTGAVLSWNPNADGEIKKMLVASNKLIVAGEFYNISGALREHIAVYDLPSLNLLSSNITNTGSYIEALCVEGNFVYYNASFFNSFYTNGVARFDINTLQTDNSWSIDSVDGPGQLDGVAILNNYVYVVGHFDNVNYIYNYDNIARFDKNTGNLDTSFHFAMNQQDYLTDAIAYAGKIYVIGNFYQIDGFTKYGIAEIDPLGFITSKNFHCSNIVSSIFPQGNTLWLGGNSATMGGNSRMRMAQVDINTGYATCWNASSSGIGNASWITAIFAQGDTVYAGAFGNFSNVYNSLTAFIGNPSYINIGPDLNICPPAPFTLSAASMGFQNYVWNTGSTNSTLTSTSPGLFWVTATTASGCAATDSVRVDFCTSINSIHSSENFIHQNLVSDYLYLNKNGDTHFPYDKILVYDLSGQVLNKFDIDSETSKINLEHLSKGMYLVCFQNKTAIAGTIKIVKM